MPQTSTSMQPSKAVALDKDVLMFIIDSSENMNKLDNSGVVKINSIKKMFLNVLDKIDTQKTNVGLISFGDECKNAKHNSKLLIPSTNDDLDNIIYESNKLTPKGKTSFASSIAKATKALKDTKKKVNIILIGSFGEECNADSYKEIKNLQNIYATRLSFYIISFTNDVKTKNHLKNLAINTQTKYYTAKNLADLDILLVNILEDIGAKAKNIYGDSYKFSITFDSKSTTLSNKYDREIKKFADYLKRTNYSAEIQGHTDSIGTNRNNQILSQKRAQEVVNKLLQFGVNYDKVYAIGYGETAPVATNIYKDGRSKNRRIEAHIIKYGKMDLRFINKANAKRETPIQYATYNSFIGYYKVIYNNQTKKKSHIWLELYGNNTGYFSVYKELRSTTKVSDRKLFWDFDEAQRILSLDYSNRGKKNRYINFSGKVGGNTNKFSVFSAWNSRQHGSIDVTRICKCELECIKKGRDFINGVCE